MDWQFALVPHIEEPRQTGKRRFGDRTLNVEEENGFRCRRPPFCQPEPSGFTHPLRAVSHVAVPDEVDVGILALARTDRRSRRTTA